MKLVCKVFDVVALKRIFGLQSTHTDDASLVEEIRRVVGDLPSYGYCRVWGKLRSECVALGLVPFNAKRAYRVMRTHILAREAPGAQENHHPVDICLNTSALLILRLERRIGWNEIRQKFSRGTSNW